MSDTWERVQIASARIPFRLKVAAVWGVLFLILGFLGNAAGFDLADAMPKEAQQAFFDNATALVNGEITAQEAADEIEAVWAGLGGGSTETTEG